MAVRAAWAVAARARSDRAERRVTADELTRRDKVTRPQPSEPRRTASSRRRRRFRHRVAVAGMLVLTTQRQRSRVASMPHHLIDSETASHDRRALKFSAQTLRL